jgi:hypothetical protein
MEEFSLSAFHSTSGSETVRMDDELIHRQWRQVKNLFCVDSHSQNNSKLRDELYSELQPARKEKFSTEIGELLVAT